MKIQYQCEVCNKLFEDKQLAEEHERTHPGYPPLKIGDVGTAKGGNPNTYFFIKEIRYNKETENFYLLCNMTAPLSPHQVTMDVDVFDKLDFRADNPLGFFKFIELLRNLPQLSLAKKHTPVDLTTLTIVKERKKDDRKRNS